MLALPDLHAVPRRVAMDHASPLAAKLALAVAGKGEIPGRAGKLPEFATLERLLQARLDRASRGLRHLRCSVRIFLNDTRYEVWLQPEHEDYWGTVWHLEPRWKALERAAPGLAASAIVAIDKAQRRAVPVLMPEAVAWMAEFAWWSGEPDETMVLDELRANQPDGEPLPKDHGIPLRADFDRALPTFVQRPRGQSRKAIERYTAAGNREADVARALLELLDALRRHDTEPTFELQDEHGAHFMANAAVLRWNDRDPTNQVFDDYGHQHAECDGVECAYGFWPAESADDLPRILAALDRRLALAIRMEHLLDLIARRSRS